MKTRYLLLISIAILALSCQKESQADRQYGLLNMSGEIIIPFSYDHIQYFSPDVLIVERDEKWGLMGTNGEPITALVYDEIGVFEGYFHPIVSNDTHNDSITKSGFSVYDIIYEPDNRLLMRKGEKVGVIDVSGKEIIPCIYDEIQSGANKFIAERSGRYELFDLDGYQILESLSNVTQSIDAETVESEDESGNALILDEVDYIEPGNYYTYNLEENNIYISRENNKSGARNKDGKIIIPFKYDDIYPEWNMADTWYLQLVNGKKRSLLTMDLAVIISEEADLVSVCYNTILLQQNRTCKLLNIDNLSPLLTGEFDYLRHIEECDYKYIYAIKDGKHGIYDKDGKEIAPLLYSGLLLFPKTNPTMIIAEVGGQDRY